MRRYVQWNHEKRKTQHFVYCRPLALVEVALVACNCCKAESYSSLADTAAEVDKAAVVRARQVVVQLEQEALAEVAIAS